VKAGDRFDPYRGACQFYPPDVVGRQRKLLDASGKDRDVTDGQKRLYERLVRYAGRNGKCWHSQAGMAEDLGKSERQVRYDLDALDSFRLIDRERKRGSHRLTIYFFLWHSIFERQWVAVQSGTESEGESDGQKVRTAMGGNLNGNAASFERQPTAVELSKELRKELRNTTDLDLPTNRKQRDSRADDGSLPPSKPNQHPKLRERLGEYMQGHGDDEYPTDTKVVEILDAAGGESEDAVCQALGYLFNERGLRPGSRNGPRSWSWFPVTIGEHFRKLRDRDKPASPAKDQDGLSAEEFDRMSDGF
jgi:hypothetical protein